MSEELNTLLDTLDAALAKCRETFSNYQAAVQLAQQAIIVSLHERGYTDAQIAAMARRRPRQRRRKPR